MEGIKNLVSQGVIPVICGFLGKGPSGEITTLGRGGSDVSAFLIGHCLDANEVIIVTDVDGVMSTDPNKIEEAELLAEISVEELRDLARSLHKLAVFVQYTLPGLPSIFAGDEAGVWGYKDPFNRKPFPWDNIDEKLYQFYCMMGVFRNSYRNVFSDSRKFKVLEVDAQKLVYSWDEYTVIVNRTASEIYLSADYVFNKSMVFSLHPDEKVGKVSAYGAIVIK